MFIDKRRKYNIGNYCFKNFISLSDVEIQLALMWRNDFNVRRYMYNPSEISIKEHYRFIGSLEDRTDIYYWMVFIDNEPIGIVSYSDVDVKTSVGELGYNVKPELAYSGIGLDFVYTALLFSFQELGFEVIIGGVNSCNKNAYFLDCFLGFSEISRSIVDIHGEHMELVKLRLEKDYFMNQSLDKNDIVKFVSYYKQKKK
ncbi:GNAT family N-acetyltransferase [Bacteroides oleiciplenus]|uniref:GNAT family N-acetyltransferase n=1 Tax=Bacteroides oleiciplenus TaxID=626931 RepID=A0A3E5B6M6_9BACE|nr:GNAT family N-acetyltransferase [Bacteroides oleiciplenus]RGN33227.1 GNAT family N-acetyltransferase [Bacteroides oleiciplenus]